MPVCRAGVDQPSTLHSDDTLPTVGLEDKGRTAEVGLLAKADCGLTGSVGSMRDQTVKQPS